MPALRKHMVMPPPMVPAPITATCFTSRVGVLSGTSGILLAARSPKKECCMALACGPTMMALKISSSFWMPVSMSSFVAISMASMQRWGDTRPRRALAMSARALSNRPASATTGAGRSRTRGIGRTAATSSAKACAPASKSPSISLAISCWPGTLASLSLGTEAPLVTICKAISTGSTRGRRCVPPPPGIRPMFTSGRATCTPGAITR